MNRTTRIPLARAAVLLGFALVVAWGWALPSRSATISRNDTGICDLVLKGTITQGDHDRLRAAWPDNDHAATSICLDSSGGSLGEAVKIADYLLGKDRVTTVVDRNAECLSACALIFMMGHFHEGDTHTFFSRKLHHTAKLGFHRPGLGATLPEVMRREQANNLFDVALDAALEYMRLAATTRGDLLEGFIPTDLLHAAFSTRADRMFVVDTVNHAGRWDIEIFGYTPPADIDLVSAANACNNITHWHVQLNHHPGFATLDEVRESWKYYNFRFASAFVGPNTYEVIGGDAGYDSAGCVINWDGADIRMCGSNWSNGFDRNKEICTGPDAEISHDFGADHAIALFPPETRLAELDEMAREIEARARAEQRPPPTPPALACFLSGKAARVVNVMEFANLRQELGMASRVIRQIPLGEEVLPVGDPYLFGTEAHRASCNTACLSTATPAMHRQVEDCVASNVVWYKVRDAFGNTGYISRKFLD